MRDVAAAAGVSTMTVSNVLSGRRPVSEETRAAVLGAVERLGYQVNVAARSLRRGRTGVVGLAVPALDSPYFSQLAGRLVERLAREGLRVVVEQTGASREGEAAAVRDSRVNAYDGLVLSAVGLGAGDVRALAGDLPVVALGERQDLRRVDHVGMANVEGARAAAGLLLERGCRRLAVVGSPPWDRLDEPGDHGGDAFRLRALGAREAVRAVPAASARALAPGTLLEDGVRCGRELALAADPVDGVVALTDTLALGVLRGLADAGLRVPDDVLVVGFDDVREASASVPSLSTVSPGHDEMVEAVVRLLLRRMADPAAEPEEVFGPFVLLERESTRPAGRSLAPGR
ncbi:LacI family DNA-binding transcriptional regulator [uncultured Pseudokineococcus sp.]|uniref:LacI family DNA-binding transcriptional regulator n=1 Tax=uncultured Pseudokineococcus sp. TaxID=1642928 RepID=UPI002610665A|nr:LacI family DNA-binding transcriptional regulator [uncultured Pseudokineococcus sp.]